MIRNFAGRFSREKKTLKLPFFLPIFCFRSALFSFKIWWFLTCVSYLIWFFRLKLFMEKSLKERLTILVAFSRRYISVKCVHEMVYNINYDYYYELMHIWKSTHKVHLQHTVWCNQMGTVGKMTLFERL